MQAGVEPLRAVRRGHLLRQHVAHLVVEGLGVGFGIEIAALPAPIGPGAGQAIEHLLGALLTGSALVGGELDQLFAVGLLAPQPFRNVGFDHGAEMRGDSGLAEVLLRQDVARHLRPVGGHLDPLQLEHDRAIRIPDLAGGLLEIDLRVRRLIGFGETAFNAHVQTPAALVVM